MSESGGGLGRMGFFFFSFSFDKFERKDVGDKLGSWELMLLSTSSSFFLFFLILNNKQMFFLSFLELKISTVER